ncbi:DUF2076 domain-containing protein [Acidobacterium sp. S8]|uniref:DUF2076 domain-containing protein n=1 Tax=Acidobacterium sp. S8 TaxID=1641854 RepID=UPI001C204335|nr:DUF2076 domain-containing protein [Acidobacterium sp. S8]
MTPQESSMLQDLIRKVQETQLTEKDPEAERLLFQTLGQDPDAIYKLAQTVLVQNLALNQARAQMQQLQQQAQQPPHTTSFLGGLLGHRDPVPPAQPQYQPVPTYEAPQYAPAPTYSPQPSATGNFLRSAATTAAGVAAGALAFEGIESLIHGHGGGWGGGGYGSGFGAPPVEETVINNYYDDQSQPGGGFAEHREHEASYDERPGSDAGLQDASYQPDTDPTSLDDTQADDFGSGDDFSSDLGGGDDSNFA